MGFRYAKIHVVVAKLMLPSEFPIPCRLGILDGGTVRIAFGGMARVRTHRLNENSDHDFKLRTAS
jgi:hypothetical protein